MVQWSSRILARDRRSPVGFIEPCLPVLVDAVPVGSEWIHELKWDGWRIIARREGRLVRLWSRNGRNWSEAFPWIVDALRRTPIEAVTIDGEAVCLLEDGRPDFHALRLKQSCREARLVAFDLLGVDGEDLRSQPLGERRQRLAELLNGGTDALMFSSLVAGFEGPVLFRHTCAMGLEGIVSKRLDTPYRTGRCTSRRKIKCPGYRRL
jgi:bifunctional non-homologous end joining protein LigD